MKVWGGIRRWLLRLLGAPAESRDIFDIVDGKVEPVLFDEAGNQLRAVAPGSHEDPFSVLNKKDLPSRLRAVLYYLSRSEYEEVEHIITDVLWDLEHKKS